MRYLVPTIFLSMMLPHPLYSAVVTVDFEDWTEFGDNNQTSADSRGFHFAADPGHFFIIFPPSDKQLITRYGAILTMTKAGGGLFGIDKLDLGEGFSPGSSTQVMLTGLLSGGGSISQIFALDGNPATKQTFSPLGFSGLIGAVFQPLDGQITMSVDNIVTPEPGAAIPFLSAVALLRRRRQ